VPVGKIAIKLTATVKRGEYYADFGRRCGCVHAVFALLEPHGDQSAIITINRGDTHGPFEEDDRRFLRDP
jgi:hypothetical protein